MHARLGLLLGAVCGLLICRPARAFERQWHVGIEAGAANPVGGELGLSPLGGVYAAYGLSDVFDVRAGVAGALASRDARGSLRALSARLASARLGLAYKLDVIEWIPYAALTAGVAYAGLDYGEAGTVTEWAPAFGVELGLDYAFHRSFALGLHLRSEAWLGMPEVDGVFSLALAAEHRWGW
jgi:hypothetical protein